ncbi:helix-turn-helix domain-containing protein [Variovorax sp. NFACC27]|jgi:DNA-binding response OmpR family regulator|uniref:Helix-turn-helix domain-containing protein n=1 Tax=Variovorax gossypii TaxID=1679495 RepID=A0A3S0GTT0_9BURK|nr:MULTISPECIES: helix-turn-helix domain-containing protein [Variovorax]MDP9606710.1 DNA-binding response OmpR family regulator [Variovorax paradoxus]SEF25183.1 Response regulator receiver domain-containing protein [Variovorax sp. NFACC28]SEG34477.1 Response regulator receiver domain-containing protein [Variovorax sp. NFACC29]SFC37029.1 Response regulator receiver domain-containing protein [Variovorax sp. NFACC26]SFF88771.1 Response regulator receiver domain-containing protein [Variovorax sp. 
MSYWSTTPPRRAHILVIDDNIEELQLLLGVLREAGHRISLAFDALEGYRRATALQPDLVLLDVRMGATDGYATCRLLKADRATARIPVIFVTSSSSVEERLTGLREGAVDYILKPFEPAEVLARVAVHLALASCRHQAQACMEEAESALEHAKGEPAADHADRVLAQAVERLVRSDLANVPALPALAASVGTHEKRLSRVFKEQTGRTVFEFAREARLAEAQRLLVNSALSVEEVALAVGFSGAANFSTAFRERFGTTPTAFRQARLAPVAPPSVPSA